MNDIKSGIEKWRELDGDNTLALDWDLNENSHVWEIGGFEGRWAQQIWDKFHCYITIFEPQMWAVEKMRERFHGNKKIDIRPYGLWGSDETYPIGGYETDGAGIYSAKYPVKTVEFKSYYREVLNFNSGIDLALMNIEGMEYDLLPRFFGSGIMPRFNYFWCQFHPGLIGVGEDERDFAIEEIFHRMHKTHEIIWNCYPTAVAWKRK